jgi:hypothetical protein
MPTGPLFARFFISIILGLVAEFAFIGLSTRLMMSFFAARWMGRDQIVGWEFRHEMFDWTAEGVRKDGKQVSVSLPYRGDSHDCDDDNACTS